MPRLIQQAAFFPVSPDRLFDMYLDPAAHGAFTGGPVIIGSQAGAAFQAFEGWEKYYWTPWLEYLQAG